MQAIHPGYGFLAENPGFADVCRSCQIDFIGPTPEAMAMLGDKEKARRLAKKADVPVVPGSDGIVESEEQALQTAHEIGFPVLIKAVAGGGGRGMRVAQNDLKFKSELAQAQAEAGAAFGDPSVYLEKYVQFPRHIEVQLIADQHGNVCHLYERDCTTQRRHQKLIEESPAPNLSEELRMEICNAAVRIAKTANYTNAGTVEFILDREGNFYFIEVNTRIQVEHPVTELVTGIDLIKTMIRVAAGEELPFKQEDIKHTGVAIECRINAEDPDHGFRPNPGRIERLIAPGGYGVRFDSHAHSGYVVPPYYDSMIGKLLVHQPTRDEAIACMQRALAELRVDGLKTTKPILREILNHSAFHEMRMDTTFVERTWKKKD